MYIHISAFNLCSLSLSVIHSVSHAFPLSLSLFSYNTKRQTKLDNERDSILIARNLIVRN